MSAEFVDTKEENGMLSPEMLQQAFAKFSEASSLLQEKYRNLQNETEKLRGELRDKDLEVKRAERLSMLGETAAGIAHEVRNPLGAIRLFLSILRDDVADMPDTLRIVEQIDKSVVALDHVVSNILQFAKENKGDFAPVNIAALVNEQVAHFSSGSSKVTFDLSIGGQAFVSGNEHSLRQVFYNLILNACQAVRYSGTVKVSSFDSDSGEFIVRIQDDGPGIPADVLSRVFEPFVTSKNEGTGLGLSIVKQILAEHDASIDAYNDSGAVFNIRFPNPTEGIKGTGNE